MASNQGRLPRACRECQQRKLGCDKLKPACTRCRDNSRTCIYELDRQQPRRLIRFRDETSRVIANASASTSDAGPSVPSVSSGRSLPSGSQQPMIVVPAARLTEIESRLATLTAALRSTQSSVQGSSPKLDTIGALGPAPTGDIALPPFALVDEDAIRPDSIAGLDRDQVNLSDLGHLSLQGGGRARFVASSFWANICDQVSAVDELLREQTRYTGVAASGYTRTTDERLDADSEQFEDPGAESFSESERSLFGDMLAILDDWDIGPPRLSRFQKLMPDIVPDLPPRELCDQLVASYLDYYHTIAPLVHIPSLDAEYRAFWDSNTQARRTKSATFVPLMVAILFAGAHTCDRTTISRLSGRTRGDIITSLHKLTAKTLRYSNFPRTPTVELLSAFLIIQNTVIREEQPLACCSYVGTAVRVAQMLGCNNDPLRLDIPLTPIAAEVRRRVSWQVYYLDVMVALAAGLPPLIDPHSWSVDPISEVKDELIGTAQGIAYERSIRAGERELDHAGKEDSLVSTSGVFTAAKYHATVITRTMLTKFDGRKDTTVRDLAQLQEELDRLNADLSSRIGRLPQSSTEELTTPPEIFAKWATLLLSAFQDINWTYLCHPLTRAAAKIGSAGVIERVLYHSHSYLQKMIILTGFEAFAPLQWSWPGIHQPLHALMVLLRYVNKHPTSTSAESYRQAIDEVLALCGPDGGMIGAQQGARLNSRPLRDGGFEVWELIHRFRVQAWVKAGLNPDIIPTRDEVEARVVQRMMGEGREDEVASTRAPSTSVPQPALDPQQAYEDLELQLPQDGDLAMGDFDLDPNVDWFQWDLE